MNYMQDLFCVTILFFANGGDSFTGIKYVTADLLERLDST